LPRKEPARLLEQSFPFLDAEPPAQKPVESQAGSPAPVTQPDLFGLEPPFPVEDKPAHPAWAEFVRPLATVPGGSRAAPPAPPASSAASAYASVGSLDELRTIALSCRACPLRDGCRGVVFGEGDPAARLMLVGEGPGAVEDELQRPFVGPAGQLLNRILAAAGFMREEVYITNVVMCRPPDNRVPAPAEVEACFPFLERKIELIKPQVIVSLGSTSLQALVGSGARITRMRGQWLEYRGIALMPTFHPAALLRDPSKKRPVWEDFQAVAARLGRPVSGSAPYGGRSAVTGSRNSTVPL